MSGPRRLANGGLIDRTKTIRFSFDGNTLQGLGGDTLASALMANGVRLVGRSFKYHRPRGIFSAGPEEPNALVELRSGARREPNTKATTVELFDGLEAASQNRWPSLAFDIHAVNQLAGPLRGPEGSGTGQQPMHDAGLPQALVVDVAVQVGGRRPQCVAGIARRAEVRRPLSPQGHHPIGHTAQVVLRERVPVAVPEAGVVARQDVRYAVLRAPDFGGIPGGTGRVRGQAGCQRRSGRR